MAAYRMAEPARFCLPTSYYVVMTRERRDAVEAAFARHDAFEPDAEGYTVQTTPFDAWVWFVTSVESTTYQASVHVPLLDSVVLGEEVAPVVQEGWLETFDRRLEDAGAAMKTDPARPSTEVDSDTDQVVVESQFTATDPTLGVADAKAFVDYVEGTYVEGIIPGYDYGDPVAQLLTRAKANG